MRPKGTKAELEERRRTAVRLLRTHGIREVARLVGASPGSVERWKAMYAADGPAGLTSKPDRGVEPKLSPQQQTTLLKILADGPTARGYPTELWTLGRVRAVIADVFGVTYHVSGVWQLLQRLGWSPQKPARRARERDEAAIARWRGVTWPKVKKRGVP